jgi:hypothetical protein
MNDNSTTMINTTLQISTISNATLAYTQEIGMMGMDTQNMIMASINIKLKNMIMTL